MTYSARLPGCYMHYIVIVDLVFKSFNIFCILKLKKFTRGTKKAVLSVKFIFAETGSCGGNSRTSGKKKD